MIKVLLTRSLIENIEIIKNFDKDFDFVNCPLIEFEDFKNCLEEELLNAKNFLVTSKHAAKLIAELISNKSGEKNFWVVGKLSANIIENAGGSIKFVAENALELSKFIIDNKLKNIIYLSGNEITHTFPNYIKRTIIYNTIYKQELTSEEILQLKKGLNYILIFSENSAKILINLMVKYNLVENFNNSTIIAISLKVANIIRHSFKNILYCRKGQYDQILKILVEDAKSRN